MEDSRQIPTDSSNAEEKAKNSEENSTVNRELARAAMKNAELAVSDIETHRASFFVAEQHLPAEYINIIRDELTHIDEIENTETIEMRRELGTLPKDFIKTEHALIASGINPNLLTVDEAQGLYDYASNVNQEIIEQKAESVANAIARIRNGARSRRDWAFDPAKAERMDQLAKKYERYERGEIDIECGFDKAYYLEDERRAAEDFNFTSANDRATEEGMRPDDYSVQAYSRLVRDMKTDGYLERAFEDMDVEELLEEGIIEEDDLFVYGPYTRRDLREDYGIFKMSTWVDAVNFRDKSNVANILQESVIARNEDTESDLLREYVAKEILPNRRPTPKSELLLFSALGADFADKANEEIEAVMSKEKAKELHDNLSWASYYAAKILGMNSDELKEEYGSTRPVSKEFFEEVLKRSEALTEQQEKWMKKNVAPYLTKLDDRIFIAEALYEPVLSSEDTGRGFEGLALPDDLFAPDALNHDGE
ncbi:hypothetical protein J6S55_00460 [Candidatus Saccharibacteria bacterium]|nr:hypothetical protein [Candidatus Saccharibacteria bacterium]